MNMAELQLAGLFGQVTQQAQQNPYSEQGQHMQAQMQQAQMQNQRSPVSQSEYREAMVRACNAAPQQSGNSEPEFNPVVLLC